MDYKESKGLKNNKEIRGVNPPLTSLTKLIFPPTALISPNLSYPPLKDLITFTLTAFLRYTTYPSLIQQASFNSKLDQKGAIDNWRAQ